MATRKKTTTRTSPRAVKKKKSSSRPAQRRGAGAARAKKRDGKTLGKRAAPRLMRRKVTPAASNPGGLAEGDSVPAFELPDQSGELLSSDSLRGEQYVLYFYPKDDTPGCTKEACGFRDDIGKFREKGVRVIGVSPDKSESHARFQKKYGLNF